MRTVALVVSCFSTVMACSIISVHLTDFKDPNDSDFRAHRMSLNSCVSTMDADHSSCNVASSNVATDGASFPALLVVMDISEKQPLKFLFTVTDNDTLIEYYSLTNMTLQELVDPHTIQFRFREASHFTGNFRLRLYANANCRDESNVYISSVLSYVECDTFCKISIALVGSLLLIAIPCVLGCCCYCLCCRKTHRKDLSHPYDISSEHFPRIPSGRSSVWTYRKPAISSPLKASPSTIEQDMSTFTPLPPVILSSSPCTPV